MDYGTYFELDGRPAVRFVRTYEHPIERVWTAVTTPKGLDHWFPSKVEIDLRVGGVVTFSGDPHTDDHGGQVLVCEPPRHLAFTWGDDEVRFDLEPLDDGGCRFTLTNALDSRDAAARNAAGWDVCLGELDKHLGGEGADGPHTESPMVWQSRYDAYVAAGVPSGAEIPDVPT